MSEVDNLLAGLEAARDDAERAALLSSAPPAAVAQLQGLLTYRRMHADAAAEHAAHAAFSAALDAAPDDDARTAIIRAAQRDPRRGPQWVAEWRWRRTATTADWLERYQGLLGHA